MGLNIKATANNTPQSSGERTEISEFFSAKKLRGYPYVFIRPERFGERPGYKGRGLQDYLVGTIIALNKDGEVEFAKANAMLSANKNSKGEVGAVMRAFDQEDLHDYIVVFELKEFTPEDGSGAIEFNVAEDASEAYAALNNTAPLEKALADLEDEIPF